MESYQSVFLLRWDVEPFDRRLEGLVTLGVLLPYHFLKHSREIILSLWGLHLLQFILNIQVPLNTGHLKTYCLVLWRKILDLLK